MAAFVTATLVAMTLPPTIPLWMSAVAAVISIAFGKMVFGGFGTIPSIQPFWEGPLCMSLFPQQIRSLAKNLSY
jgi:Na+-translocating ferredoxin:NAD+ oxidoreductase RnfD subunit